MADQPYQSPTAADKRQVHKDTYAARAEADWELNRQGRHAAQKIDTTGNWSGFNRYPKLPATSPWSCDPVPPEPPIGTDVSETPVVGEPAEIAASLEQLGNDGDLANSPSGPTAAAVELNPVPPAAASTNPNSNRRRGL
jgi:hypothetical protein